MDELPQLPVRLRLYIRRDAPESRAVEDNLRAVFDSVGLAYEVEVFDVDEDPDRAEADRILLTPTLRRLTPPALQVAGDLSDVESALDGLGLRLWSQRADAAGDGRPDVS